MIGLSNAAALQRLVPWGVMLLGAATLALATWGLDPVVELLERIGLPVDVGGYAITLILLFGAGLLLLIVALLLALARARNTARLLIGSGLALLILGNGPLFAIKAAARLGLTRDPDPFPVSEDMLAQFTFIPAIALLICGLVALARRRYRSA